MSVDSSVRYAVRRVLLASLIAASLPAAAQDTAPARDETVITVTGTRIQRQDYEATSPIATVSAEAIQATGLLNTEAVLDKLPQVVPGTTSSPK